MDVEDNPPKKERAARSNGHTLLALLALFLPIAFVVVSGLALWLGLAYRESPRVELPLGLTNDERAELEKMRGSSVQTKEWRTDLAQMRNEMSSLSPREELRRLADQVAALEKRLSDKKPEAIKPPPPPSQVPARVYVSRETVICVLNSSNVEYNKVARPALFELFKGQTDTSSNRLGLVVVGPKLHVLVKIGETQKKEADFESNLKSPQHTMEEPSEELAAALAGLFAGSKGDKERRLLLIASSDCRTPDLVPPGDGKARGWKTLQEMGVRVDVVLIPTAKDKDIDLPREIGDKALGWPLFCAERQGFVYLLRRYAKPAEQKRVLLERLRKITAPTEKRS